LSKANSWKNRLARRLALTGADLVTLETNDVRRAAIRAGARAERVRIVQFGVDTAAYRPAEPDPTLRAELGLLGRRVVFSPRQIAALYDHISVVKAVASLPSDVAVVMSSLNADTGYLSRVEAVARDLGVRDRLVIVPGIRHEVMPRYIQLADVVVSIPASDSISVSVLEAMACGRPVVVSDLASPREWLEEVSPDLIAPVGDVPAIARALHSALTMDSLERARRAELSRRIVVARGDRETNMLAMESMYVALAARWASRAA
jgi:glycosyltransferase involved in cell wall biosynthesis